VDLYVDMTAHFSSSRCESSRISEVTAVLKKMKRHKAPALLGLVAEMIQATGYIGTHSTQWILDLCNSIVKEGCISEDWKSSVVLPIYRGKGEW